MEMMEIDKTLHNEICQLLNIDRINSNLYQIFKNCIFQNKEQIIEYCKLMSKYNFKINYRLLYNIQNYNQLINYINYSGKMKENFNFDICNIFPIIKLDVNLIDKYPFHGCIIKIVKNYNSKHNLDYKDNVFNSTIYYVYKDKICNIELEILRFCNLKSIINYFYNKYNIENSATYYNNHLVDILNNCNTINDFENYLLKESELKILHYLNRIAFNNKNIDYLDNNENLIVTCELIIPTEFLEDNYKILKSIKKEIYKMILNKISNDKRFKKYGIPINMLKISKSTISKNGLMHVVLDLKML